MDTIQLHFEQYKLLRDEIMRHQTETQRLETYAIAAIAALYAWLSTNPTAPFAAWFIGLLIPLFFGIRSYVLLQRIRQIASYLRDIEKTIFTQEGFPEGWETRFKQKYSRGIVSGTSKFFWWTLLIVTLVAPFLLHQPGSVISESDEPGCGRIGNILDYADHFSASQ